MFLTCTIHSISSDGTVTTKFMHAHTHTHYQFLQNCRTLSKQGHCDLTSNLFSLPFTWFIFFCFSLHWYFFFKNGFYEKIFVPLIAYQGFEDFFYFKNLIFLVLFYFNISIFGFISVEVGVEVEYRFILFFKYIPYFDLVFVLL